MFELIIDDNTRLELIDNSHAEELFNLISCNRSHLRKWLPWIDANESVEELNNFIALSKKQFEDNNGFQTVIVYKGKIAGVIGFHYISWMHKHTSIGYWLAKDFQGHGIMTKSCKALISYAYDDLNLNRIEIRCAVENKKSRAIPERLGFTNEGVVREAEWLYNHYVNHVIYGLLRNDI